ncbi:peptide/nickel transport system ATP-binding protein [Halorubrum aquaticum]|uniref:Peptide/nickel transport system ATP-binding protein n=1 Tax=Halorubrum aquaticum TaxID=387340 RepID=A0A1I3B8T0_9EURY|nr:ABC transporter ATP-binding protein [Halorubrum aquaticum]SFH58622.1 peptide/nickel transport system ATP-binding protein [Halorubrum aquaticum]
MSANDPVLELRSVDKHFQTTSSFVETVKERVFGEGPKLVRAVDDLDMTLEQNQVQGVIGESGCGKTTLLRTVMGLYDPSGGDIRFQGQSTSEFDKSDWKEFRRKVQIVFQDPFNSLDPKFSVRRTIAEPLEIHDIDYERSDIEEMLEKVGLTPASQYIQQFPNQLSGGEKQRVAIARALITDPEVILADEPSSMLDVSTQASILNLLNDLTNEFGVSMIYISHDLSTVSYVCDEINVMYLGRIVEKAETRKLLSDPKHPYTKALIQSIPIPDPHHARERATIGGEPGDPIDMPEGCRFKTRCPERMDVCDQKPRDVDPDGDGERTVACHLYYDHEATAGQVDEPAGEHTPETPT